MSKSSTEPIRFVQVFQTQDLAQTEKKRICAGCQKAHLQLVAMNGRQTTTYVPPILICLDCWQQRDKDRQK